MKKYTVFIVLIFIILWCCTSCRTSTTTIVEKQDSIIYVETLKDTTIYVPVPQEKTVEVVPMLDTLTMETSVAKATAYLDTSTCTLKGALENKPVHIETKIQYIDKYKTVTKYRTVEKTKVRTRTPKWCWFTLSGVLIYVLVRLFGKRVLNFIRNW